jgi:hypothetical protein
MNPEDEKERVRKDRRNERTRKRRKERRASDPEFREKIVIQTKLRRWRAIYKIDGMTIERYEQMSAHQGDACKICRREIPGEVLCLDHRHATGWVRGLLCRGCNIGLGGFNDNPIWLVRAAIYIVVSLTAENVSRLFARFRRRAPPGSASTETKISRRLGQAAE